MARARVFVKVCGITSEQDAQLVAEAGADAVGFVFWTGSPRRVSRERAAACARALPAFVVRVGVFVDAPREEIERTAETVGLDLLQLHGQEPPEALAGLSRRALKALHVGPGFRAEEALRYAPHAAGLLVDTRLADTSSRPGGTGSTFDWSLVLGLRERTPFLVLAGGLHAGNVGQAIAAVRPQAVDVSSGVELAPGRKDAGRVRAFVEAVRRAS